MVNGLEPGHRYALRCSAINELGSSGCGPVAHAGTLPGLPFPVDSLHLVAAASTSLKVQWRQPFGQGCAVSGYALELALAAALAAALAVLEHGAAAAAEVSQLQEEDSSAAEQGVQQQELQKQQQQQEQQANGAGHSSVDALFQTVYQGSECGCTGELAVQCGGDAALLDLLVLVLHFCVCCVWLGHLLLASLSTLRPSQNLPPPCLSHTSRLQ